MNEIRHTPQSMFEHHCQWYSLLPTDFGREFIYEGQTYIISGLRLNAVKDPICVKRVSDGESFVLSEEIVRQALHRPDTDPFGLKTEKGPDRGI